MTDGEFNQQEYNKFVIENDVVGFFPQGRTLKSGRFSYWYANCRNMADTAGLADKTAGFLINFLKAKGLEFDYVYGVPEGVTKLATVINYKMGMESKNPNQVLVIGRGKPKEHGDPKDKYFIGPAKAGDKIVVVEDVTTTGGSMLSTLDALKEAGIEVAAVVALVNRMEIRDDGKTVAQCVEEKGSKYFSMSDADQLIPLAIEKYKPGGDFLQNFQEKYNEFAIKKINVAE
jgi:orotate phosphoribosyltransferase